MTVVLTGSSLTERSVRVAVTTMASSTFGFESAGSEAAGVSVSGLGYAGLMGLRTPEQLADVRAYGPMRMLVDAAGTPD